MRDSEADTCRKYVLPKLYAAGWSDDRISEQKTITDGRIIPAGQGGVRRFPKRPDYLLRYRRDFLVAVVEAKVSYKSPGEGLQKAMEYAGMLGLKFAYSTNGHGIVEHDFISGRETRMESFPGPEDLWRRLGAAEGMAARSVETLLAPCNLVSGKVPRYYQEIAINRAVQAILRNKKRILLTMATGTGKTTVAFQIIWKLWSSRWNGKGELRNPRILYLSDRNILVDKPKDIDFAPLGDARFKIENGEAPKSREIYFAIYQSIARDERRPGLFKTYSPDFFDLIIVDECHRGSANDDSNWREILEYFEPAFQLGMTATPERNDNKDTYRYFGNPVYTYSLKQGIEDGFLAPYRVHRVVPSVDATGWRPEPGQKDRDGRVIPDEVYYTPDFETRLAHRPRTEAIAKHISNFLKGTNRFDKAIVFCVDQDHAEEMRIALSNENADLVRDNPDYAVRITADEADIGLGHLDHFTDLERATPVLVTTSKLLSTGVDIPTCKIIAIARRVESMTEFKQIIGRGTRVRDDYGKYFFTILDYTGSATRLFADPDFDGEPALISQEEMDAHGRVVSSVESPGLDVRADEWGQEERLPEPGKVVESPGSGIGEKYHVDEDRAVEIVADVVYELDPEGHRLQATTYVDYTRREVRLMYSKAADLRSRWSDAEQRAAILEALRDKGISLEKLAELTEQKDADHFDLLCHVAFSLPLRTRRERAEMLRRNKPDLFERYSKEARAVLDAILDKYVEYGDEEFGGVPFPVAVPFCVAEQ